MAISLVKGQKISLEKSMKLALVGLGWDTNRYDGGHDFFQRNFLSLYQTNCHFVLL